jgi:predicted porin
VALIISHKYLLILELTMRKHTLKWLASSLALALAAPSLLAQTTVNAYGLLDLSVGASKAAGGSSVSAVDSGKMSTSYLGFSTSEDLGGQLSALVRLESFMRGDTGEAGRFGGDAFWARTAIVGLSHKQFGTLTLGRNTTALFVQTLLFNAFGDSFGYSPSIRHYFTSGTVTGDTGWNQSLAYASPAIGNLRFGLASALRNSGNLRSNGGNWSANIGYSAGPLALSAVVQNVEKDGPAAVADTRTTQFNGAYDFGMLKAYLQVGEVKNHTTGNKHDITGVGLRMPVGTSAVIFQHGNLDSATSADRKTTSVGYLHSLSKRTELYGVYMNDKVDGTGTHTSYSLGMRHRF